MLVFGGVSKQKLSRILKLPVKMGISIPQKKTTQDSTPFAPSRIDLEHDRLAVGKETTGSFWDQKEGMKWTKWYNMWVENY